MSHYHAVVWLDHAEARIFHVSPSDVEKLIVHPQERHRHLHHKAGVLGDGKAHADTAFFDDIGDALEGAQEILVVGPGRAKLEFVRHVHRRLPDLEPRIVGVETVDHPSDGQVVAHARAYFKKTDRMQPVLQR